MRFQEELAKLDERFVQQRIAEAVQAAYEDAAVLGQKIATERCCPETGRTVGDAIRARAKSKEP
jgi:hypothetical protein